jgi:hypothetical protein
MITLEVYPYREFSLLQPDEVENSSHVKIEHFLRRPVWRWFKRTTPSRAGIRNQNVNSSNSLFYFIDQSFNIFSLSNVGSDSNSSARHWELIEPRDGLIDALLSLSFPRCDYDLLCAGEEEGGSCMKSKTSGTYNKNVKKVNEEK